MFKEKFTEHAALLPPVTPEEVEKYDQYFTLLKEWNEKINLVSRKSIDTSFAYHYADSLWIAEHSHKYLANRTYKDVGTGAGFPGLVFAIRYPQAKVRLYEKLAKRRLFLEDVIQKLELKNTALFGALPDGKHSDLFTARAVFPVEELLPFMKRHMNMGGRLVVTLGSQKEIPEPPRSFKLLESATYELPEGAGNRKIAIFEFCST